MARTVGRINKTNGKKKDDGHAKGKGVAGKPFTKSDATKTDSASSEKVAEKK